ncbi:MAG: hypothetical protein HZB80_03275 [Deltaproteobacteria bacterium]|nr:hypothetical protein [Deltaproteobacteria bacterium]
MDSSGFKTLPPKTLNESKQHLIEILKVQAAVLYDFLSYTLKLPENEQPTSLKALLKVVDGFSYKRDLKNLAQCILNADLAHCIMNKVYNGWIGYNEIKGWYDKEDNLNTENFLETYIKGGRKMTKTDIEKAKNRLQFMDVLLYDASTGYDEQGIKKKTNPALDFLVNLSRAINVKYRSEINPDSICPSNPNELDSIREVLQKLYPSISFPLS